MQEPAATILVGDDEIEARSFLELSLKSQGYQVQTAVNGEEVLNVLMSGALVNAVLLDITMSVGDGFETLREIRRFNRDIPVIMLAGAASPANIVTAMKGG